MRAHITLITLTTTLALCTTSAGRPKKGEIQRTSLSSAAAEVENNSTTPSLSASGRLVAFSSSATRLVPGDTNNASDIFLHDRKTDLLTRESVGLISLGPVLDSINPNGSSFRPSLSANGRYLAFETDATNIVAGSMDTNGARDVVMRDRRTRVTIHCSVASNGVLTNASCGSPRVSASGRHVVYHTIADNLVAADNNGAFDIFLHDTKRRTTERVSVDPGGGDANGFSFRPDISGNGRFVVFDSLASDLVPGDGNGKLDVFLRDRKNGTTFLISRPNGGGQANGESSFARIARNGRYVVFQSTASNLVAGDGNGQGDVFLYDHGKRHLTRISAPAGGGEAAGSSSSATISDSGRIVAFASTADNLVAGDANGLKDVFRVDRRKGTILRISRAHDGGDPTHVSTYPELSASGRIVAFESLAPDLVEDDGNNMTDIFCVDTKRSSTERVSLSKGRDEGNAKSAGGLISPTGRYVLFNSFADDLIPDDSNGFPDAFLRDRKTGVSERISLSSAGGEANGTSSPLSMSSNARFVLFISLASNLAPDDLNGSYDLFLRDRKLGTTNLVSRNSLGVVGNGNSSFGELSGDGRCVVFTSLSTNLVANDNNGFEDVFHRDLETGQTTILSVGHDGSPANGNSQYARMTPNGRYIVFQSEASNLVPGDTNNAYDIFVVDRKKGKLSRVSRSSSGSQGNGGSQIGSFSASGRYVTFTSAASNLVAGDTNLVTDVFVHDRKTGRTELVSRNSAGAVGNDLSSRSSISRNGRYVAFSSLASNLSPDDADIFWDIYLHDRKKGTTVLITRIGPGASGDGNSYSPFLSANGRHISFTADATNLVRADKNGVRDGFVFSR